MKRIPVLLFSFAAALVLVLGLAGPSYAWADGPVLCNPSPGGACVWFTANGDVIHIQDTACDGHAAVAEVQEPADGIYDAIWNNAGCGTIAQYSYGASMPENRTVYYRPCLGQHLNPPVISDCNSGWTHGTS